MSDIPTISFPLTPLEKTAKTHAILCTTGFLILLPIGALVARFARTFSTRWWTAHFIIQFLISGPVIYAGWYKGHQTAVTLNMGQFVDTHQKTGLALLILYVVQLLLGAFIHFIKLPAFRGRRSPQNYFHVFLGLVIFVLAAFQSHYGLYTEWDFALGGLHHVPQSAKHAWLALIIVFWVLYFAGMMILFPRQMRQERLATVEKNHEGIPLHSSYVSS